MSMHKSNKNGFTIVELMVALLTLAVLTLIVGAALLGAWRNWERGREAVQMQQDVSLVFRAMASEIRQTPIEDITVGTSLGSGSNIFTKAGNDLTFKNVVLINDMVTSFASRKNIAANTVSVSLSLSTGDDMSQVRAIFHPRN